MQPLAKAIKTLKPNAEFTYKDDDYATINWIKLDGKAPTQKEIDDVIEQIKADEAQAVIEKATAKAALLTQLGITAEQAKLLLS